MSHKTIDEAAKLDQGRDLARRLYDIKIGKLQKFTEQERKAYQADYPLLGRAEVNDVLRQVITAKKVEQIQVGWFTIPHDITALVFVLVTCLFDLKIGIIAATAVLVLLESFFQVYFNPRIYPQLSWAVWLTYPAYILLGWVLYSRNLEWYWVAAAVAGAWGGIYLAGIVARIPMQLIIKGRLEAAKQRTNQETTSK